MKVQTILDQIDMGSMALPEFQRGYVWNREQVRGLMQSLYRRHPVGSLLVWVTKTEDAKARGDPARPPGIVHLLLDGQQRITSLYGIVQGKPPQFFDGDERAFTGLHFHLDDEVFEFYAQQKMKDNPRWISVTELMRTGVGPFIVRLNAVPELRANLDTYVNRLTAIHSVTSIDLHIEDVTGEDKTVDIVVDIFNRVNSGGTKLSKGDLALAKVCAAWPEARAQMKARLEKWKKADFSFRLELLLRCINTIVTGEALFAALADVDVETFRKGLRQAEKSIDGLLNMISGRLGLDHDRVLGSRYSFPVMARYLMQRGGHLGDHAERDRLLYWYIHTFLWGRYAASTESTLNQDLALIEKTEGALDRLINQLRQNRGDLKLNPNDFIGWSRGARFYPLLYMLTRVWKAKDWCTGIPLSQHLLGNLSGLQVHHVFPRALLYKSGYSMPEVNALANLTFLTQECNLIVTDRDPSEYFEWVAKTQPGALESHWIPMDKALWKVENYLQFLTARRELLASAANDFLDSLLTGAVPEAVEVPSALEREDASKVTIVVPEDEERVLQTINEWVLGHRLPEGEFNYELADEDGRQIAVLDLAWPEGLQEGLSSPVALLLNESEEVEQAANAHGFRYFTHAESFKDYVAHEILALEEMVV